MNLETANRTLIRRLVEAELDLHRQLKDRMMNLVLQRCQVGYGKIKLGMLASYVYYHLGLHGFPGNDFINYLKNVLEEEGFRITMSRGNRCISGLYWKGEDPKHWNKPKGQDLPQRRDYKYIMPSTSNNNS